MGTGNKKIVSGCFTPSRTWHIIATGGGSASRSKLGARLPFGANLDRALADFKSPVMYDGRCERHRPLDHDESKLMRRSDQRMLYLSGYKDPNVRIIVG